MTKFLKKEYKEDEILEKSADYAKIGLRTLVFGKKILSEEELKEFEIEFSKENNQNSLSLIEHNMEFLGRIKFSLSIFV